MDMHEATRFIPPMINQTGKSYKEKIAIIGAGPAGMSCAFYLAQKGYRPTVFDQAGKFSPGMIRCTECGKEFNGYRFDLRCPVCRRETKTIPLSGRELIIKEIRGY